MKIYKDIKYLFILNMPKSKKILDSYNLGNVVKYSAIIIGLVLVGILIREMIKNKWLNLGLTKKIRLKEDFTTLNSPSTLPNQLYVIRYRESVQGNILEKKTRPNTNSQTFRLDIADNWDTNNYGIDDMVYFSNKTQRFYSLLNGTEYNLNFSQLNGNSVANWKVKSGARAGTNALWYAEFIKNGSKVTFNPGDLGRGLNFYIIKPNGDTIVKSYDLHLSWDDRVNYTEVIQKLLKEEIPVGSVIMIAIWDQAYHEIYANMYGGDINDSLKNMLTYEDIGLFIQQTYYRSAFAYIGIKLRQADNYESKYEKLVANVNPGDAVNRLGDVTEVQTQINTYYIYPDDYQTKGQQNRTPYTRSVLNLPTVDFHSINDAYKYYINIPDGLYLIKLNNKNNYKKYYIAQQHGTILKYNIYELEATNLNPLPFQPYRIIVRQYNKYSSTVEKVKIFNTDGYFINSGNDNCVPTKNTEYKNNKYYTIRNSTNKYITSTLSSINHGNLNTLLKTRTEHLIFKFIHLNDGKFLIINVTSKQILKHNNTDTLTLEGINDTDYLNILNDGLPTNYDTDIYKFNVLPYLNNSDRSSIIFIYNYAQDERMRVTHSNTSYRFLRLNSNTNTLELTESKQFMNRSQLTEDYKFYLDDIPLDSEGKIYSTLVNYYKTEKNSDGERNDVPDEYIHINHESNPHHESDCRFLDKFNKYRTITPYIGDVGCNDYNPEYIKTVGDTRRQRTSNYRYQHNKTIDKTAMTEINNATIKECYDACQSDERCAAFEFPNQIEDSPNNPVVLGTCKLHDNDSIFEISDYDVNSPGSYQSNALYFKNTTSDILDIIEETQPTRNWTAEERNNIEAECNQYSDKTICNNNEKCEYRDGKCRAVCEFSDNTCKNNVTRTIGSLSNFNIKISAELMFKVEPKQIKVKITSITPINITHNFTYPKIRNESGILLQFVRRGVVEYSNISSVSSNRSLTVSYDIDYNNVVSENKLLNPNDTFTINIPAELCSETDCNKLIDEYTIKVIFIDIYGVKQAHTPQIRVPTEIISDEPLPTQASVSNSESESSASEVGNIIRSAMQT